MFGDLKQAANSTGDGNPSQPNLISREQFLRTLEMKVLPQSVVVTIGTNWGSEIKLFGGTKKIASAAQSLLSEMKGLVSDGSIVPRRKLLIASEIARKVVVRAMEKRDLPTDPNSCRHARLVEFNPLEDVRALKEAISALDGGSPADFMRAVRKMPSRLHPGVAQLLCEEDGEDYAGSACQRLVKNLGAIFFLQSSNQVESSLLSRIVRSTVDSAFGDDSMIRGILEEIGRLEPGRENRKARQQAVLDGIRSGETFALDQYYSFDLANIDSSPLPWERILGEFIDLALCRQDDHALTVIVNHLKDHSEATLFTVPVIIKLLEVMADWPRSGFNREHFPSWNLVNFYSDNRDLILMMLDQDIGFTLIEDFFEFLHLQVQNFPEIETELTTPKMLKYYGNCARALCDDHFSDAGRAKVRRALAESSEFSSEVIVTILELYKALEDHNSTDRERYLTACASCLDAQGSFPSDRRDLLAAFVRNRKIEGLKQLVNSLSISELAKRKTLSWIDASWED